MKKIDDKFRTWRKWQNRKLTGHIARLEAEIWHRRLYGTNNETAAIIVISLSLYRVAVVMWVTASPNTYELLRDMCALEVLPVFYLCVSRKRHRRLPMHRVQTLSEHCVIWPSNGLWLTEMTFNLCARISHSWAC